MDKERKFLENLEREPQHNEITVDFLRHGKTEYTDKGRDLTLQGEQQIRESAERIIETIDPKKETVVLWSSPAPRAQGSEEIIKEALAKRKIEVYKDSEIHTMRNFDQKDKEFMEKFLQEAAEKGISPDVFYAQQKRGKNEKFETQEEVRKRMERVFNWIRHLAEHANLQGRKLHIIGVSHFEFLNPLIKDIFGYEAERGESVTFGEIIKVNFDYNSANKEMSISAEFRGQRKDNIIFDKEKRKFIYGK